jgi:hypothetical protein
LSPLIPFSALFPPIPLATTPRPLALSAIYIGTNCAVCTRTTSRRAPSSPTARACPRSPPPTSSTTPSPSTATLPRRLCAAATCAMAAPWPASAHRRPDRRGPPPDRTSRPDGAGPPV